MADNTKMWVFSLLFIFPVMLILASEAYVHPNKEILFLTAAAGAWLVMIPLFARRNDDSSGGEWRLFPAVKMLIMLASAILSAASGFWAAFGWSASAAKYGFLFLCGGSAGLFLAMYSIQDDCKTFRYAAGKWGAGIWMISMLLLLILLGEILI